MHVFVIQIAFLGKILVNMKWFNFQILRSKLDFDSFAFKVREEPFKQLDLHKQFLHGAGLKK